MANVIESGIGTLNYGKQSAKGTDATAATTTLGYNRPRWVGGALKPAKMVSQEEYVDGQRFASPTMFTDRIGGEVGDLQWQVQAENAGLFAAQILGVDTTTGASDPYTHTITSAGTGGLWGTWWQKVGSAVGPVREMYSDSKIAKLMIECGVDQKVMRHTASIMCLDPAEKFGTDAARTEDSSDPFLWTEVSGAVTFDTTVISETNGETLEIDTGMQPYWGDSIAPLQLVEGKGLIVRTLRTIVTDDTLLKYYKTIYNTATPSNGDNPVKDVFYAACTSIYTRSATRTITHTTPRIAIRPDDMQVAPQPEGGTIDIEFGGPCLKSGATAALTVIVLNADATTYA